MNFEEKLNYVTDTVKGIVSYAIFYYAFMHIAQGIGFMMWFTFKEQCIVVLSVATGLGLLSIVKFFWLNRKMKKEKLLKIEMQEKDIWNS